jgi:hypothetical protein
MSQPSAADMGETADCTVLRMEASKLEEKAASSQAKAKDPSLLIPVTFLFSLIPLGILSMHILLHRKGVLRFYGTFAGLRPPSVARYERPPGPKIYREWLFGILFDSTCLFLC